MGKIDWGFMADTQKIALHFLMSHKRAGKMMPVSVAIGGDLLYIWVWSSPNALRMLEPSTIWIIRRENPILVKSFTNGIYFLQDVDL